MSDLSRRAFGAILGSGAFVWFDKNYQGNGGTGGGNVTNPEAADIQLDDAVLDVTSDTVTVDVDAANFGGETGDATVLIRDQVEELASQNVTLEAGAVEALQFTNDYTNITADDVTLDVVNDQYPLAVDLTVPRQHIQFTGGRIEDTNGNEITEITEGQTFYVIGTAENVGDRDGEKTYVLYGNDTEIDSQLVTLTTGGSTTLEFSHSYDNLDLGPDETAKQVDLSVNEQGVGEISIFPPAIPDSVVSRTDDKDSATDNKSWGLVINPNDDFGAVGARISSNSSDPTRARLFDYDSGSYVASTDISGKTAGETFALEATITAGQDYGIELDAEGASWGFGYNSGEANYPYTGSDIDIVGRSTDGSKSQEDVLVVNDIGNPDGVLD